MCLSVCLSVRTQLGFNWIDFREILYFSIFLDSVEKIQVSLTLNIPRGVLWGPPLVCYWLTSVEINKHKIFDTNNTWITELKFQKPKKRNLSNLQHQTVEKLQKKTMGSSEDPSLVNNVDELGLVY